MRESVDDTGTENTAAEENTASEVTELAPQPAPDRRSARTSSKITAVSVGALAEPAPPAKMDNASASITAAQLGAGLGSQTLRDPRHITPSENPQVPVPGRLPFRTNEMLPVEPLGLDNSDRFALAGAALALLSCALPWKWTALSGQTAGFWSLGLAVFIASVLGVICVLTRTRAWLPRLHPLAPWLLQLGASCFCVLWCLVFMKLSSSGAQIPGTELELGFPTTKPMYGVYVALTGSLINLGGTLLGLKEKAI